MALRRERKNHEICSCWRTSYLKCRRIARRWAIHPTDGVISMCPTHAEHELEFWDEVPRAEIDAILVMES